MVYQDNWLQGNAELHVQANDLVFRSKWRWLDRPGHRMFFEQSQSYSVYMKVNESQRNANYFLESKENCSWPITTKNYWIECLVTSIPPLQPYLLFCWRLTVPFLHWSHLSPSTFFLHSHSPLSLHWLVRLPAALQLQGTQLGISKTRHTRKTM